MEHLLAVDNVTKRFGDFTANDRISLQVPPGERLAVLGENGAGKSTMMRMLAGELEPTSGSIVWRGEEVRWRSARDAQRSGIGMVHQHFLLVPPLTAAENIGLGYEPRKGLVMDRKGLADKVRLLGLETGLAVEPNTAVQDMTVAAQQKVEILKALYRDVELLILDEPTASLAPQESADLLVSLRRLSEKGITLIFVSHKLPEVLELCDRIAVLRAGKLVATLKTPETSVGELARLLVGRETEDAFGSSTLGLDAAQGWTASSAGPTILSVRDLVVKGAEHETGVDHISFDVSAGEILALAGVDGNGQAPLADALLGLRPVTSGAISLSGRDITTMPTADRYGSGVGFLPEDRQTQGMVLDFPLSENVLLGQHNRAPYAAGPALASGVAQAEADRIVRDFDVRTPLAGHDHPSQATAGSLSGGNQQKFLFGREVGRNPKVLIAYQPTRGLDVGATEMLHHRLRDEAARGRAVLLISLDLDEVLSISDRVAVLYKGRIAGEMPTREATRESIGRLMIGAAA